MAPETNGHDVKLSTQEKILLFQRLATMLESGKSVSDFLKHEQEVVNLVHKQSKNKWLGKLTKPLGRKNEEFIRQENVYVNEVGKSLAQTAPLFPGVFDESLAAGLKIAESHTGEYAPFLKQYVEQLVEAKRARDEFVGALMYPVFALIAALIVFVIFVAVIVPGFKYIYDSFGPDFKMPAATLYTVRFAELCVELWFIPPMLGLLGAMYPQVRSRNPQIRYKEQQFLLRTWVLGDWLAQMDCRFLTHNFVIMIDAGALHHEALRLAGETMSNLELRAAVREASLIVAEVGRPVHEALAASHPIFAPGSGPYSEFAAFGETGQTDSLRQYARILKENADITRKRLIDMTGPAALIAIGGLIGFLVFVMYMPLFSLIGQLSAK